MTNDAIAAIPRLELDVGITGTEVQDSTVGGICVAVGIIAGVFINQNPETSA